MIIIFKRAIVVSWKMRLVVCVWNHFMLFSRTYTCLWATDWVLEVLKSMRALQKKIHAVINNMENTLQQVISMLGCRINGIAWRKSSRSNVVQCPFLSIFTVSSESMIVGSSWRWIFSCYFFFHTNWNPFV